MLKTDGLVWVMGFYKSPEFEYIVLSTNHVYLHWKYTLIL